jgi:hypothetical protein
MFTEGVIESQKCWHTIGFFALKGHSEQETKSSRENEEMNCSRRMALFASRRQKKNRARQMAPKQ